MNLEARQKLMVLQRQRLVVSEQVNVSEKSNQLLIYRNIQ